jgi:hypothetical protein
MNHAPLSDAVVTHVDPRRQREPIVLSHFPLPHIYRESEKAATQANLNPVPLTLVTVYYTHCYGAAFVQHWTKHVGVELYYLVVGKVAMSLARDIRDIEAKQSTMHRELLPLPSLFIAKLFQVALSYRDPGMVKLVCEAFHRYCELVNDHPELKSMADALKEPIALLEKCTATFNGDAIKNYNRLLQYGLSKHALTIGNMVAAIEAFGKDVGRIIVRRSEQMPEHPLVEAGAMEPEPPQEASPESVEASVEEEIDRLVPEKVEHLDGSVGYSAHRELAEIYEPIIERIDDTEALVKMSMMAHPDEPFHSALELWWKTSRDKARKERENIQAWVLEPAARFLKAMFTPEQFATMAKHVAIQEVVNWVIEFIIDTESAIPHLSWGQLRISAISLPTARVAYLGNVDGVDLAVQMYEAMGLHDEISLLRVTLDIQSEGMRELMENQGRMARLATRH